MELYGNADEGAIGAEELVDLFWHGQILRDEVLKARILKCLC